MNIIWSQTSSSLRIFFMWIFLPYLCSSNKTTRKEKGKLIIYTYMITFNFLPQMIIIMLVASENFRFIFIFIFCYSFYPCYGIHTYIWDLMIGVSAHWLQIMLNFYISILFLFTHTFTIYIYLSIWNHKLIWLTWN